MRVKELDIDASVLDGFGPFFDAFFSTITPTVVTEDKESERSDISLELRSPESEIPADGLVQHDFQMMSLDFSEAFAVHVDLLHVLGRFRITS